MGAESGCPLKTGRRLGMFALPAQGMPEGKVGTHTPWLHCNAALAHQRPDPGKFAEQPLKSFFDLGNPQASHVHFSKGNRRV
jgi:hypothetical protein